jgi:hypothetical protein
MLLRLVTQYNSPETALGVKQYCLQQAIAPSVKAFTLTQNVLRPIEIQNYLCFLLKILIDMQNLNPNRRKARIANKWLSIIYHVNNEQKHLISNGLREFPDYAKFLLFAARARSKHYCLRWPKADEL